MTLIEKLEAAPEGSRRLDVEICNLDDRYSVPKPNMYINGKGPFAVNRHNNCRLEVPHYTTSIDAALTLSYLTNWKLVLNSALTHIELGKVGTLDELPLAICIAALKAVDVETEKRAQSLDNKARKLRAEPAPTYWEANIALEWEREAAALREKKA